VRLSSISSATCIDSTDERGFFRETIGTTDDISPEGFDQWSHSLIHTGAAQASSYSAAESRPSSPFLVVSAALPGECKKGAADAAPESGTF
jgi:hypothetical protein